MAKLPSWMKVVETKDKGATMVIVIRWWHPHVWGIVYHQCRKEILDKGHNPNHLAMRWLALKTTIKTVWDSSKRAWLFN